MQVRHDVPPIPQTLSAELAFTLGADGAARWLGAAVELATELMSAWELAPRQVLAGGSMSLCVKCERVDGTSVVLKVPADLEGGDAERAALRAWDGNGAARLLREDEASAAMLMSFLAEPEELDLARVVDLVGRLHSADPGPHPFGSVAGNVDRRVRCAVRRFEEPGYEGHRDDLRLARDLLGRLVAETSSRVLLHGDLQVKNLLASDGDLTAVDPLPTLGPAVFDLAFWVAKSAADGSMSGQLQEVATLRPDVDRELLLSWTWALAVVENRPYLARGRERRQQFIESRRDDVLSAPPHRG